MSLPLGTGPAEGPAGAIRVLLRLESRLWSELLAAALERAGTRLGRPTLEIVGVWSPDRLTTGATAARADVALLGLASSPRETAELRRLRSLLPTTKIIVLGPDDAPRAARLLRAGARGYVDEATSMELLVKAIRTVHGGELWAERRVAAAALEASGTETGGGELTAREARVLAAVGRGKRNKEIAVELDISEATVKTHLNRVYRKLRVSDRLQAGLLAAREGWEQSWG